MKDKELIKLAAKAAGVEHPGGDHSIHDDGRVWDCNLLRWWNPLTDDGDALRLAVKLGMTVSVTAHAEQNKHDLYAVTRRDIVLAAAEIGKAKP